MKIKSIKKSNEKSLTVDIEVKDTHSYQLKNGVVSHNSVLLQTANGIHGEHAPYYFRHVQINENNDIAKILKEHFPEMVEKSVWGENDVVVAFPFVSPENSIYKDDLLGTKQLEYVKKAQQFWVERGTVLERCVKPTIRHNVSNTIMIDDWEDVIDYVYKNRAWFAGISFIPLTGDVIFPQAPNAKVKTEKEIIDEYGVAALFSSGLICHGIDTFGDLWLAINTAKGIGIDLSEESHENANKRDFVRRFKKFADNYFDGNYESCEECLKSVYYLHKWEKIQKKLKEKGANAETEFDFASKLTEKKLVDIDTMGAVACSGGSCSI